MADDLVMTAGDPRHLVADLPLSGEDVENITRQCNEHDCAVVDDEGEYGRVGETLYRVSFPGQTKSVWTVAEILNLVPLTLQPEDH